MPSAVLTPYEQVPETKEKLDWAELVTLDLSEFEKPGGKQRLASQLEHAAHHVGFFYVKNFGISQQEVDRQFALGREFYDLPLEERLKYHNIEDLERGEYNGYRPSGLRQIVEGVKDNIQVYNTPKFDGFHKRAQPKVLQTHIEEIEKFSRDIHEQVVQKLLRILAVVLELDDEDQLARDHVYDKKGEDHLRYMHYKARTPEENEKIGGLYAAGHTDLGTITLLFRQPVAALQILNSENEWKWVKPQDATITVNICDALSALTGGYLKSSIHRVHTPPKDQAHIDRLGVLFFARLLQYSIQLTLHMTDAGRPNNHVVLETISNSPVLNRGNFKANDFTALGKKLTVEEWVKVRQTQQQRRTKPREVTKDGKYMYAEKDLEIIPGLTAKIYN
ncbi:putative 2-oxoglutarate-dependent dioxygenase JRG21 [Hyphodiscus hymeniophilus]|uniref:2-oxoglutarate-dependent dioxygenase JRG21 n=1 Tax=Hyphodiscus hymeniophilus TaxID=353542 RepID=A0A9P7AYP9_9HELO|nr:putative 2-oxoglutarate-dependent dioxygenase JRG21 [Hyphodiscus hymeniophilus]